MATTTGMLARSDFRLQAEGTIAVLFPLTDEAATWCWHYLPADATRWGNGYVIEHRFVDDILFGIHNDGLVIADQGGW